MRAKRGRLGCKGKSLRAETGQDGGCAAVIIDQWQAQKLGVAYNRHQETVFEKC